MSRAPDLGDYVDVASRIAEFRQKFPNGSLRPLNPDRPYTVETIGEHTFIVVVAAAFREANDKAPGVGMAMEPFPGRTPYTRGSELQNAETSAWGRAIVAVGAADTKRGIASADEVRGRVAEGVTEVDTPGEADGRQSVPLNLTEGQSKRLHTLLTEARITDRNERLAFVAEVIGRDITSSKELTRTEAAQVVRALEVGITEPKETTP